MQTAFSWIAHYGYGGLFCLLMLGIVGLPVPDETLMLFCGFLIYQGHLHATPAFLAGWGGSITGITISFVLGRFWGRKLIDRFGLRIGLTPQRVAQLDAQFERFGAWLLAVGYFIPGVRHFSAVMAGMSEMRPWQFVVFAYGGGAVWVGLFLSLGYLVGDRWEQTSETVHHVALAITAAVAAGLVGYWLVRRFRGRREV